MGIDITINLRSEKNDTELSTVMGIKKTKHKCGGCAAGFVFMAWIFYRAVLKLIEKLLSRV
jgi:hypothetical protein